MRRLHFALVAVIVTSVLVSEPAYAQVRASEAAVVQQTVDGTKITVEYSRPAVRGRTVFGSVVHWGERWTPGANWATTLEVDRDIRLAGQAVPKGKYALWLVPRENADWTLVVHPRARTYHTQRPDTMQALLRIPVKPAQAAHVERLTFSFPAITPDGTVLEFRWGTTMIQLPIRVPPSRPFAVDAADVRRYVGAYPLAWRGRTVRMDVFAENGKLRGRMEPNPLPFDAVFDFVASSKDHFRPLFYQAGQPFDTEDFAIVFVAGNGVEWRGIEDRVLAKGTRTP